MAEVRFVIPGRLKGKGRPRATARGGFARMYTPADTINAESMVRRFAADAMGGLPAFEGPLILDVTITLNRPASWPKKRKAAEIHATGKPDLDNIVKLIGDACNGIIWKDDAQLCEVRIRRAYNDLVGEQVTIHCYAPGEALKATPVFGEAA